MEPITEEGGILQEWSPETELLQQIPVRVQKGIFSKYVNLTCLDVVPEYIALGTNCGLIYWYCRAKNEIQRLHLESSGCTVTCVKIVSTVDYMVAAGADTGNVTVFQIPKSLPESVPGNLKAKKNQVERFTINGLHTVPITSIEWSQNGMKLFSGDKSGTVVLTEIDFYMHITKSVELLNEQFEIVQLKYSQQILLISTTFRSIICDGHDKWKVHQVGTKERKILGKFGATICKFDNEWVIYVSRPGHRLWLASLDGSVRKTLLFKSSVSSSHPKIQLINPFNKRQTSDTSFGKLVQFGCNKLVIYNSERMYVVHPNTVSTVTSLDSARKIIDLAVNDDEIFILEGERSLLRIGYAPNKFSTDMTAEGTSKRRSFILDDIATKLKDTALESFKKITSDLVITPEPASPVSQPVLADEALDLPPIVNLPAGSISTIIPDENVEIHFSVEVEENVSGTGQYDNDTKLNCSSEKNNDGISKGLECNEVLSRPLRRRSSRKNKVSSNVRGQDSESDVISNVSDDRLTTSQFNEMSASDESSISFSQSQSSFSILRDIPTLLTGNNGTSAVPESLYDETTSNVDDNSQISLDTCESVSENLKLTPERFLEEQEKTFFRLANQEMPIVDNCSSEKTDNMSVSLNLTQSGSSISSKISNSGQWISEISENISMMSETKTESPQNDLPLPKQLCFYNPYSDAKENRSDEDVKPSGSGYISLLCETRHEISDIDNISSTAVLSVDLSNEEREDADEKSSELDADYGSFFLQKNLPDMDVREGLSSDLKPDFESGENLTFTENDDPDKCDGDEFLAQNLEEQSDHWLQYTAPGPVTSLAVSSAYVVCINSKDQVYFSRLSELSLIWNPLNYRASRVSVSNNGSTVWILNKKTLFSLVNPSKRVPLADEMIERYSDVKFFTLDNENPQGWIVKTDGKVKHQRNLEYLYEKLEDVPCDWLLTKITRPTRSWSPQSSGGTMVATEAHNAMDSIVFESDELAGIYSEHGEREEEDDDLYWADSEAFWATIEAGACLVDVNHLPHWFTENTSTVKTDFIKPWRLKILDELKSRTAEVTDLDKYEKAIDTSSWVKTGNEKCLLPNNTFYQDCILELEWVSGGKGSVDCGTLTISSTDKTSTLGQISMNDVIGIIRSSLPGISRISIFKSDLSVPIRIQFKAENDLDDWVTELSSVCCRIRNISSVPSPNSVWMVTALGDIYACDLDIISMEQQSNNSEEYSMEISFPNQSGLFETPLLGGFLPGSSVTIKGCVPDKAEKFMIDFRCCSDNGRNDIAFHFNPRLTDDVVVRNAKKNGVWGPEDRRGCQPFNVGAMFELKIIAEEKFFAVFVNNQKFVNFAVRESYSAEDDLMLTHPFITHLACSGDVVVNKILYTAKNLILPPSVMYWRQIEGHLRKVESAGGVTWGIGFDNTAWVYMGGNEVKGGSKNYKMSDSVCYYVYENQRWNPLTGYTSHGLPTDRFMWSDATGKHKRKREKTNLLSNKWHWANDWAVDYHTPGGVDKEGWQYAMDFPSAYHGKKHLTDYVRRRRWVRKAKLDTEGPWTELGHTLLSDCSIHVEGDQVVAWAVASNGYVLFRRGISKTCHTGLSWEHVPSDSHIVSISSAPGKVWAISKSGTALWRFGVTASNLIGEAWNTIEAPAGSNLKQVSVGEAGVWVLDSNGRLSVRREETKIFPEGTHWETLPLYSAEQVYREEYSLGNTPVTEPSGGFRYVSSKQMLWAVTSSGQLVYRLGISAASPSGMIWVPGIESNSLHICG